MTTGEVPKPPIIKVARPVLIGPGTDECNNCAGKSGCLLFQLLQGRFRPELLNSTAQPSLYDLTDNGVAYYQDGHGNPRRSAANTILIEEDQAHRNGNWDFPMHASFKGYRQPPAGFDNLSDDKKRRVHSWLISRTRLNHHLWHYVRNYEGELLEMYM